MLQTEGLSLCYEKTDFTTKRRQNVFHLKTNQNSKRYNRNLIRFINSYKRGLFLSIGYFIGKLTIILRNI